METIIGVFLRRLRKIGVHVELVGNYPWIYLDKVNGKKVKGTFEAEHGFTAFWSPIRMGQDYRFSDISVVFKKIRETLEEN